MLAEHPGETWTRAPRSSQVSGALAPVLDAGAFRGAVVRERKRAERSGQSLGLLLLELEGTGEPGTAAAWTAVLEVVAVTRRKTDIAGWLEEPRLLGVLLPEFRPVNAASFERARAALLDRVERELAARLDAPTLARCSVAFHAYPEARQGEQAEGWPVDPIFHPELAGEGGSRRVADAVKRGLDAATSLALLVALAPLLALVAVLVRLTSPGPVLFRQVRIGRGVRPFTMLKFRSMYTDVDARLHQEFIGRYIGGGRSQEAGTKGASRNGADRRRRHRQAIPGDAPAASDGPTATLFKLQGDPRVTPLGRLLRKTSLDELPQLWNVLRGDMSLVGPRPPLPYELEQYEPWHRRRVLEAKPGVTGLWQVRGRSRTTFEEMVRLDLEYIRTRSLWTDFKILLATPRAVISGDGAV